MKFMKNLSQKKLVKAVVCGLLVSGGMFAGMGQAHASWISGAVKNNNGEWIGKVGTEVKVTAKERSGAKLYDSGKIYGADENEGLLTIEGGTFNDNVYGGQKNMNKVFISGGTFNGEVYGGHGNKGINMLTISGGTFNGDVYGMDQPSGYGGQNTVTLVGEGGTFRSGFNYIENKSKIQINGLLCSINRHEDKRKTVVNHYQTLNVAGKNTYVEKLGGFEKMNFYINKSIKNGDTLLKIKGSGAINTSLNMAPVNINAGVETGSMLKEGDKVTLIECEKGIVTFNGSKCGKLYANDFRDYDLKIEQEKRTSIVAKIASGPKLREDDDSPIKSPVETQAAGLQMLTTGADMLAGQGFDNAASAIASEVNEGGSAKSLTPFVTVGGAKTRVNSGSHIDVNGWHLNVGLAKELKNKSGKLLIGPVVEYGKGSYDSYLDNGFHGEGDTHYIGGGVMAKQTNNNGFYYEGSLRAGKLSNDYKSNENSSNKYDSDSTYYAAHVGLGKILKLNDKNSLDYYGKYFYTHQKGNDATLYADGEPIDLRFDSVDSNRTRLGARFTHALNEKNSIYAGLAWQHEFSGTARATIDSTGTPAPSVKGNTGIMELGWKVETGKKLDLDLNATGYTGKQKGASLNLSVNFKF